MSDLLKTSATKLAAIMKSRGSSSITYQRRGQTALSLTATSKDQTYEVFTEDAGNTLVSMREYIFTATDLTLSPPAREGDLILETIAGTVHTFTVAPVGDKPCFDPLHDKSGQMTLVRCKK
jgi:hypothetical protein